MLLALNVKLTLNLMWLSNKKSCKLRREKKVGYLCVWKWWLGQNLFDYIIYNKESSVSKYCSLGILSQVDKHVVLCGTCSSAWVSLISLRSGLKRKQVWPLVTEVLVSPRLLWIIFMTLALMTRRLGNYDGITSSLRNLAARVLLHVSSYS